MRIVGGTFRGHKLRVPTGNFTRPTTERVREAIFNVLGDAVAKRSVLDIYAGSGSLGIEALSRGASRVVFVESHKSAADTIQTNINAITNNAITDTHIIRRPIERCIDSLHRLGPFDLCLVDPPFAAARDSSALHAVELVATSSVLSSGATLVLEYPSNLSRPLLRGLELFDVRDYGDSRLAFFEQVH